MNLFGNLRRRFDKRNIADNPYELVINKSTSKKSKSMPKGFEPGTSDPISIFNFKANFPLRLQVYNFATYRQNYLTVPAVHACIDGICREIANMKWGIKKRSERSAASQKLINRATEFFQRPNRNKRPFSHLIYCIVKDALLYSAAAIENVKNKNGELVEIYPRDGSTIIPKYDSHGSLFGYKQIIGINEVNFGVDELVYIEYNPDTYSPGGAPILDGLGDVCEAIRNSIQFLSRSLDYNSIPPGILSASDLSQKSMDSIVDSVTSKRDGARVDFELTGVGGVTNLQWLELKRDAKDLKQVEILNALDRQVFRSFGVTPIEIGEIQDVNRASALVQQSVGQSQLKKPLVDLVTDEINEGIIWTCMSDMIQIFAEPNIQRTRDLIIAENNLLIPKGQRTINEARKLLNEDPLEGGDVAIYVVGGTFIKVSDLNKEVIDIKAYNVSQPDKNPNQEQKEEPKKEPEKEQKTEKITNKIKINFNKINEILKNKRESSIKNIIYNYFSPKGNLQNCVDEIVSSYYGNLLHNADYKLDSKMFRQKILDAIKKYEGIQLKNKKYTQEEYNNEKSKLHKELNSCFDEIIEEIKHAV